MWRPAKEKPVRDLSGLGMFAQISEAAPTGSSQPVNAATKLATRDYQLEGFVALPDNNMSNPPDSAGAVSPEYVVTALNTEFRIQDRAGRNLRTLSMERFWAPLGPFRSFLTDPRIAWDQTNQRFVMIMLADIGESTSSMLLARSVTADPLGDWRMTRISAGQTNRDFDYPNLALAGSSLAISVDVYNGIRYEKTMNFVISLASLFSQTGSLNYRTFEDFLGTSAPASDPDRNRHAVLFVNSSVFLSSASYALTLKTVRVNGGEIVVSSWIPAHAGEIFSFYGNEGLPQAGTERRIESADAVIQNCTGRGETVWCVNSFRVRFNTETRSIVQLYRLQWPAGTDPTLVERIRIDDPSGQYQYSYPSIAMNRNGEILVGYNRFHANEFVGAYFATRRPTDLSNSLDYDVPLKAGEDSYVKGMVRNRWGDYSTTLVDPADDTSFWTLQEYAGTRTEAGTSLWGTYWVRIAPRTGSCAGRLSQESFELPSTGGTIRVALTLPFADCRFLAEPNASWIQAMSANRAGTQVNYEYRVGLNRRPNTRSATITLGSATVRVRQAANATPPTPEPVLSVVQFDAPVAARVGDSLTLSAQVRNTGTRGAGRFRIGFYLSRRLPVTNRDLFTGVGCTQAQGLVTDELVGCTGNYQLEANLEPGTYYVAAIADDREEIVMSDRSPGTRVSDAGPLVVQAAANAPAMTRSGVVHGATAVAGAVSPGGILVLYGQRLGPAALTTLSLDAQGRVATVLGGTRILFDGIAAPLLYSSAGQVSVIVPYAMSGRSSAAMVAEHNGIKSAALNVAVEPAAPGLFTVDFSGRNQVAALNEDGTVNGASQPAERGKLLVLYGTGAGVFRTAATDGGVVGLPLPEHLEPLRVEIDGRPAEVLYQGPAPGLVSGVFQINVRVPAEATEGVAVPVTVLSGALRSPAGTTVALK